MSPAQWKSTVTLTMLATAATVTASVLSTTWPANANQETARAGRCATEAWIGGPSHDRYGSARCKAGGGHAHVRVVLRCANDNKPDQTRPVYGFWQLSSNGNGTSTVKCGTGWLATNSVWAETR